MNKKDTALFFFDYVGTFGGAQQSTSTLLNHLYTKYPELLDILVISTAQFNPQFIKSLKVPIIEITPGFKFNIFKVGKRYFKSIAYIIDCSLRLHQAIKTNSHDQRVLILCNSSKALYTIVLAKLLNPSYEIYFYSRGDGKSGNYNKLTKYLLNRFVNKVLCVSQQTKENMQTFIEDKDKLDVTYTSVDLNYLDNFYPKKSFNSGKIKVLFAGALIPMKGLKDLINGIVKLPIKYQEQLELYIAGDFKKSEVKQYVEECKDKCLDLSIKVEWLGWVKNMPDLISNMDIICLPSYSEGLPRIVQEGMYLEKVVISTPVGGVPSLIEHGYNGYLIDLGSSDSIKECLITCIDNPDIYTVKKNARSSIQKNFNIDNQVKLVLDSLLNENH